MWQVINLLKTSAGTQVSPRTYKYHITIYISQHAVHDVIIHIQKDVILSIDVILKINDIIGPNGVPRSSDVNLTGHGLRWS